MNSTGADSYSAPDTVERRVWRNIFVVLGLAVVAAAILAEVKFTLGLALGGLLALFNYRWLQSSLRATLAIGGEKAPPGTVMRFVLRWFIVALVVYAAYSTGYLDAVAMLLGLFAPALAVVMEAAYVTYKAIVRHIGER